MILALWSYPHCPLVFLLIYVPQFLKYPFSVFIIKLWKYPFLLYKSGYYSIRVWEYIHFPLEWLLAFSTCTLCFPTYPGLVHLLSCSDIFYSIIMDIHVSISDPMFSDAHTFLHFGRIYPSEKEFTKDNIFILFRYRRK